LSEVLRFAQDFACGLPLRSRPQSGSSSGHMPLCLRTGKVVVCPLTCHPL